MNETIEERLEGLRWVNATRPLTREEAQWLIEQAERAQELMGKCEFTDVRSILNSMKECDEENKRMREALEVYAMNAITGVIARQALEGLK